MTRSHNSAHFIKGHDGWMTNRDRLSIYSLILDAATSYGMTRTKIMYTSMLSNEQCRTYMDHLIRQGLLEYREDGYKCVYRTTARGEKFLDLHREMEQLVPDAKI